MSLLNATSSTKYDDAHPSLAPIVFHMNSITNNNNKNNNNVY